MRHLAVDQAKTLITLIGPQQHLGVSTTIGRRLAFADQRLAFRLDQTNHILLFHIHTQPVVGPG